MRMAPPTFETRIRAAVRASGAPHHVVLRDYALSYVLAAIYAGDLGAVLAFKGGTALRKCYFPGYRFSEDLDFTLLEQQDEGEIEWSLRTMCVQAEKLTAPYGRFRFIGQRQTHRGEHPFGQIDYRIQVEYPTGASLPIKLEITGAEPVVFPLMSMPLIHLFKDEPVEHEARCYRLDEIVIEKLRAFLQARQNLARRNWLNRPRDLYDLWYLYGQREQRIEWSALREPLAVKAHARGLTCGGPEDFKHPAVLREYRRQWEPRLREFVPVLPPFDEAVAAFTDMLEEVFA